MKFYFQTSTAGDWCKVTREGIVVYEGHSQPSDLTKAVLRDAGISYEHVESDEGL